MTQPQWDVFASGCRTYWRRFWRLKDYLGEFGPRVGFRWYLAKVLSRLRLTKSRQLLIRIPSALEVLTVRMYPSTDEFVFDDIFVQKQYAPVCEQIKDPRFVLDLGANVGYASVFFANQYGAARILAVEPDPLNFEVCCRNLNSYGERVKVLKGAVWPYCSRLALSYGFGSGWATQVKVSTNESDAEVEAWDIPTLLDVAGVEIADLIKIDIEGSEIELFAANSQAWLRRTRNLCIELHGGTSYEIFHRALSSFKYQLAMVGELTVCLNLQLRDSNN